MMLDLALVVSAVPALDPNGTNVELPSRNGGSWRGSIVERLKWKKGSSISERSPNKI